MKSIPILVAWAFLTGGLGWAGVRLPGIFSDHMVLQRGMPVPVWGWADAGEGITVRIGGVEARTRADARGAWSLKLPPLDAGGPFRMVVIGDGRVTIDDILVGEVWFCSGQSNMEWELRLAESGPRKIPEAHHPGMRLFLVPRRPSGLPRRDVDAAWSLCTPWTACDFSAVAYFFGLELHRRLDVPVGLIGAAWGGTAISTWTAPEGFAPFPEFEPVLLAVADANRRYRKDLETALDDLEAWTRAARSALDHDRPVPLMPYLTRHPLEGHEQPTGLYNGMVRPVAPFGMRGVIWYQGENNVGDGMAYHAAMKALIQGWRKVWGQGGFPFYYVQLAPFRYEGVHAEGMGGNDASHFALQEIWEAQRATLSVPNTGMVVTTDLGNLNDIHPRNKREVGRRLALWALARTYGFVGLVCSGPLFRFLSAEGDRIRVHFDHVGSGLVTRDGKPLKGFEIAGTDGVFVEARGLVDGDTILLWKDGIRRPAAVRFGWNLEAVPNLVNKEGLPASPFHAVVVR